jgi:hypothetical protein
MHQSFHPLHIKHQSVNQSIAHQTSINPSIAHQTSINESTNQLNPVIEIRFDINITSLHTMQSDYLWKELEN